MAKCGGFLAMILKIFSLFASRFNKNFLLHKLISAMYYIRDKKEEELTKSTISSSTKKGDSESRLL